MRGTWQDSPRAAIEALPVDPGDFIVCEMSDSGFLLVPVDETQPRFSGEVIWSEAREQYRARAEHDYGEENDD